MGSWRIVKKENGRRTGFRVRLHPTLFFHGDIRDSRKYDTFRGKHAVLFINLLGKGLTQEINEDGGSIWWAPVFSKLFYRSSVWSNTTQTNLDKLQAVQNFAYRTVSGAGKLDHTTPSNVKGLCAGSREATAILSTCSVLVFKCMTRCAPAYLTSIKVRKKIGRFDKDNQELGNVETLGVESTTLLHC